MGLIQSNIIKPQQLSLKHKLELASTCTSHILEETPFTIHLNDINNVSSLKGQIPDNLFDVVSSNDFKEMQPHLFRRIYFHDRMCKISLVIESPNACTNPNIIHSSKSCEDSAMCINTTFLNNS